jgi:hypothetical protein
LNVILRGEERRAAEAHSATKNLGGIKYDFSLDKN